MMKPRFSNAIGNLDDDLIEAAAECKKKKKPNLWLKWGSVAACFAILVVSGAIILSSLLGGDAGTPGKYKDIIQAGESAIIWPWEYQTVYEQYTDLELDGVEYRSKGRAVSADLVGKLVGTYTVVGYDEISDKRYTEDFEVYELKYADKSQFVAVKMDGKYYTFKKDNYAPPSNLGELLDLVDFPQVIELSRFSENGDSADKKHYTLNTDDYVWEVLAGCREAKFIEEEPGKDNWKVHDREYLSFTVTSETLGVYRVAMYITKDGYLWTNAFDYRYLFNIGEDAAGKIIEYAMQNSTEAEYEPYQNTVTGKVIEITEEYILIDDTVICNDPADGTTYKILLNDLRIKRYVDHEVIKVGENVQITFEGEVDDSNTIDSAISAANVTISKGEVLNPE
ncbi:MAG: hypothetical protein HFJ79_05090 [Clostridiales bacterium]|nr:hypothetical protein [Clostridiales bacterium]